MCRKISGIILLLISMYFAFMVWGFYGEAATVAEQHDAHVASLFLAVVSFIFYGPLFLCT